MVQGVGFRPFLYRAAKKFRLTGSSRTPGAGVTLEVEGGRLPEFVRHIERHAPPLSHIETLRWEKIPDRHSRGIRHPGERRQAGKRTSWSRPTSPSAPPARKRWTTPATGAIDYPFTNCTDCGPRFTIIEGLPYDRPLTTMKRFAMCPDCRREYDGPADRRYHAQPVSCPQLRAETAVDDQGQERATGDPLAASGEIAESRQGRGRQGRSAAFTWPARPETGRRWSGCGASRGARTSPSP